MASSLRSNLGEGELSMRKNQLAAANMLCLSATVDILQFLTHSGSGNVPYIMIPNSPNITKQMSPPVWEESRSKSTRNMRMKKH